MQSHDIRSAFLDFFAARDHALRPSASLIPVDPTLLLTNAGMVPFKPYFLGEEQAPWPRATTSQKVVRTIDIDIIGTTDRHLSFFEMLGNFSFGDYFKEKAIPYAYEFSTEVLRMDPERIWYTVHETDDEAEEIWIDGVGVPAERVQRGGKDNFWQMGVPGPCGPSSELFYDRGPEHGAAGGPIGGDEDRYVEYWNLVFMQNIQDEPYHVIGDLPARNIDTGMGLERVAMILQEAPNFFLSDALKPMLDRAVALTGVSYGSDAMSDVSLRILADHGKTVTMLIGDGVVPSNEGRGYVLRRVLRRAVRHAWQLGGRPMVMSDLAQKTIELMGQPYPNLVERSDFILEIVEREEARFRQTLDSGHGLLDTELSQLSDAGELSGTVAFRLHDTYGFPIELTKEVAAERGVSVDMSAFDAAMEKQRQRARGQWKGGETAAIEGAYRRLLDDIGQTRFIGYDEEVGHANVLALIVDGDQVDVIEEGQTAEVFLDVTPFYAEAGGQVGDVGTITGTGGTFEVRDTQPVVQGLSGHQGVVAKGALRVGEPVTTAIDSVRRERIRKSHTATHMLHAALREVVGDHVQQAGSLVEAGRLRFDFSHFAGLEPDEFEAVEHLTNERVIHNDTVSTLETSKDEAEAMGALAFFGDKYGEQVRVVTVGDYSVEFCGGTHTPSSGQVGPVIVLGESSIGSNLRRVEALTGVDAYGAVAKMRSTLDEVGAELRVPHAEIPDRVRRLVERAKELEATAASAAQAARSDMAGRLADSAVEVGEHKLVVNSIGEANPADLRTLAVQVRERIGSGLVVLGSRNGPKGALVGTLTPNLVAAGLSAADVVLPAATELGGGGSRDPELCMAGGPRGDGLDRAVELAREAGGRVLADS